MNDKFIRQFKLSGYSKYSLAKKAGIPYTTVSELLLSKKNINKTAAETVARLALVLGVNTADVLNEYDIVSGIKGKYRGIKYELCLISGFIGIKFQYKGKLEQFSLYVHPEPRIMGSLDTIICARIDEYFFINNL